MKKISFGVEDGALYKRTEALLREYNSMQARVKNLEIDLANLAPEGVFEEQEETIEGLAFRRCGEEGMPQGSGETSDRTASVALKWRKEHGIVTHEMWRLFVGDKFNLEHEKRLTEGLLRKIDNAIDSLSEDEQLIIRGFYIDQKPWYDITHEVQYVERHCKRLRTRAIWYMSKSIFGVGRVRE
ncbi:MAG TPA: hypothetical protein DCZ10_16075 [Pelotomaculum sp.]|nr:hypothetical protein [Pelotomaculum sp.]